MAFRKPILTEGPKASTPPYYRLSESTTDHHHLNPFLPKHPTPYPSSPSAYEQLSKMLLEDKYTSAKQTANKVAFPGPRCRRRWRRRRLAPTAVFAPAMRLGQFISRLTFFFMQFFASRSRWHWQDTSQTSPATGNFPTPIPKPHELPTSKKGAGMESKSKNHIDGKARVVPARLPGRRPANPTA